MDLWSTQPPAPLAYPPMHFATAEHEPWLYHRHSCGNAVFCGRMLGRSPASCCRYRAVDVLCVRPFYEQWNVSPMESGSANCARSAIHFETNISPGRCSIPWGAGVSSWRVLNVALRGRRVVGVFFLFSFRFPQLQGWQCSACVCVCHATTWWHAQYLVFAQQRCQDMSLSSKGFTCLFKPDGHTKSAS